MVRITGHGGHVQIVDKKEVYGIPVTDLDPITNATDGIEDRSAVTAVIGAGKFARPSITEIIRVLIVTGIDITINSVPIQDEFVHQDELAMALDHDGIEFPPGQFRK